MIASNGACEHINGYSPSFCNLKVDSDEIVKSDCTNLPSCVGYEYTRSKYGYLFVSDKTCPDGYDYFKRKHDAKTINDLVYGYSYEGTNCYGKIKGKCWSNKANKILL